MKQTLVLFVLAALVFAQDYTIAPAFPLLDFSSSPPVSDFIYVQSQDRWYATTLSGLILTFPNSPDATLSVAADLSATTWTKAGAEEQGFYSLVAHPTISGKLYFWKNYQQPGDLSATLYLALTTVTFNATGAPTTSEEVLLQLLAVEETVAGGGMAFGDDGFLYLGVGDLSAPENPTFIGTPIAQDPFSLFGKVLRLNVDVADTVAATAYSIPRSNPFSNGQKGAPEVFALGFRQPYKIAFAGRKLLVTDVGLAAWEEINVVEKGRNYGWPIWEGTNCLSEPCPKKFEQPFFEIPHTNPLNDNGFVCRAITGFANIEGRGPLSGVFFSDFFGSVYSLDLGSVRDSAHFRGKTVGTAPTPIAIESANGQLYVLSIFANAPFSGISSITFTPPGKPGKLPQVPPSGKPGKGDLAAPLTPDDFQIKAEHVVQAQTSSHPLRYVVVAASMFAVVAVVAVVVNRVRNSRRSEVAKLPIASGLQYTV
jgi:hypothetical protein